jgi:cell division protein FtsB|tara:strand:+ start:3446 stop:3739 length:294 start_codon:yes stop_codon:yes gene_type:complete
MRTWIEANFPILNAKWEELLVILENTSVMERIAPTSGIWADKENLEFVSAMTHLDQYQFEVKRLDRVNDKLEKQITELKQELLEVKDMLFAVAPLPD